MSKSRFTAEEKERIVKEYIEGKERIKIVKYCIAHDCDYKNTAAKYDVSYRQHDRESFL